MQAINIDKLHSKKRKKHKKNKNKIKSQAKTQADDHSQMILLDDSDQDQDQQALQLLLKVNVFQTIHKWLVICRKQVPSHCPTVLVKALYKKYCKKKSKKEKPIIIQSNQAKKKKYQQAADEYRQKIYYEVFAKQNLIYKNMARGRSQFRTDRFGEQQQVAKIFVKYGYGTHFAKRYMRKQITNHQYYSHISAVLRQSWRKLERLICALKNIKPVQGEQNSNLRKYLAHSTDFLDEDEVETFKQMVRLRYDLAEEYPDERDMLKLYNSIVGRVRRQPVDYANFDKQFVTAKNQPQFVRPVRFESKHLDKQLSQRLIVSQANRKYF